MSRIATNQLVIVSNKDEMDSATAAAPILHSSDGSSSSSSSFSSSPASAQLTAPPPSPVHSSNVPSSPFSSMQQTTYFATPPPSCFSTASSASSSLSSSPLQRPSPSSAHIPPLLPYYDDEVKQSLLTPLLASSSNAPSVSTLRDHKDGEAWQDSGEKGFHSKEAVGRAGQADDEKRDLLGSKGGAQWSYGASLKEQERQARQAEREQQQSVEHRKAAAEEEKYGAEQHKLLHLLISMYRCRECLPTWKDREEQRLGIETNEYASRRLQEFCCVGHALSASFPPMLPLDLLPLTQGYLLNQPTRSFLTHPPPPSAGVIQWSDQMQTGCNTTAARCPPDTDRCCCCCCAVLSYILKTSNKFELFMEMRDQSDWQLIRKKMMERGHLPEAVAAAAATAAGGYGGSGHERSSNSKSSSSSSSSSSISGLGASAAEKERERSELLERLFRDRQAWRQMMKGVGGGKTTSSPSASGQSGKGSASNMSLEDRMRENNQKSMLLQHAESLLTRNEDIFLLAAQRRRAWTGNSYLISMDREGGSKGGEGGSREFIGRLKSNFGGTEFVMYDYGVKPGKRHSGKKSDKQGETTGNGSVTPLNSSSAAGSAGSAVKYLRECGVIQYDHFFEHTGSPIRIKILLPNRSFYPLEQSAVSGSIIRQYKAEAKDGNTAPVQVSTQAAAAAAGGGSANVSSNVSLADDGDDDDVTAASAAPLPSAPSTPSSSSAPSSPAARSRLPHHDVDEYEFQTPHQHVEVFENLRPVWHDGMNAYVLHFDNHRVREKSVKNFKLVRNNDDSPSKKTVLQFGRVMDRNVFVMDFAWPLSAFQAFAICLSSIDPKIAV